jgi:hypothetical protein
MKLPEVRKDLLVMADLLEEAGKGLIEEANQLRYLAEQTKRRRNERRGSRGGSYQRVTPERAAAIRAYAEAHPDLTQHEISVLFEVNNGRISEALNGRRT